VTFEMGDEESVDTSEEQEEQEEGEEDEDEEEDGAEGSQTPHAAAHAQQQQQQRPSQTITSTSPPTTAPTRRPSRLRRLSSATQSRVSPTPSLCTLADRPSSSLRYSNPAADPSTPQPRRHSQHLPTRAGRHHPLARPKSGEYATRLVRRQRGGRGRGGSRRRRRYGRVPRLWCPEATTSTSFHRGQIPQDPVCRRAKTHGEWDVRHERPLRSFGLR